jgi:hypothetical protein
MKPKRLLADTAKLEMTTSYVGEQWERWTNKSPLSTAEQNQATEAE